jgi:hypothetical protein
LRTIDFSSVFFEALQLAGLDRYFISDETFGQARDIINQRLRMAWESQQWPELIKIVKLTITLDANNAQSVAVPADAGEIFDCYNNDPRVTSKALTIPFDLYYENGSNKLLFNIEPVSDIWVRYRIRKPDITGSLYDSTVVYYKGSQIYFDSGSGSGTYTPISGRPHVGNFYTCVAQSNTVAGQNPISHPALWQKVDIPYVFGNYLSRAFVADNLRSELQFEAAQLAENDATLAMDLEVDKLLRQQGQMPKLRFNNPY